MNKRWRAIQPPHPSENITLEEAMEAWRKVEGKTARPRRSQSGDRNENPAVPVRSEADS
jgi:hypothetical protein